MEGRVMLQEDTAPVLKTHSSDVLSLSEKVIFRHSIIIHLCQIFSAGIPFTTLVAI